MTEILGQIKETLPILITIFAVVFFLILLTRVIFMILLHFAKKRYEALKRANPFKRKSQKRYEKEEDELLREIPKAHSATRADKLAQVQMQNENYELVESAEQQQAKEEISEMKIVDIVKPMGFWTSMILGQKMTYLIQSAQTINKRQKQGFWVSMIEAQEQAAGRQHGRTR